MRRLPQSSSARRAAVTPPPSGRLQPRSQQVASPGDSLPAQQHAAPQPPPCPPHGCSKKENANSTRAEHYGKHDLRHRHPAGEQMVLKRWALKSAPTAQLQAVACHRRTREPGGPSRGNEAMASPSAAQQGQWIGQPPGSTAAARRRLTRLPPPAARPLCAARRSSDEGLRNHAGCDRPGVGCSKYGPLPRHACCPTPHSAPSRRPSLLRRRWRPRSLEARSKWPMSFGAGEPALLAALWLAQSATRWRPLLGVLARPCLCWPRKPRPTV